MLMEAGSFMIILRSRTVMDYSIGIYNVFNELHYSGSKNKIKSINTNINLDYKFILVISFCCVVL